MKAICSFILALAVSSAGAQIRPVESLPIAVNYSKTIHLVFPSAVKYNQAVTDFVAVDNPESVPNILRIKANRKSFSKQTTVSVATEGGFFYSFNVTYADSLEHTNYFLPDMSSIRPDTIYLNEVSQTQLMQLPVAFVFGYMTDFACWCIADVPCPNYLMQVVWCLVGIVLVGVGVAFEVVAGVVTLAGEGLVLAICKAFKTRFDVTKVVVDVSLVALACVASYLWLGGKIHGVREGTLAAALLVGVIAQWCNRPVERLAGAIGINTRRDSD